MASSTWTGAGSSAPPVAWPLPARSPRSRAWPLQAAVASTAAGATTTGAGSAGCPADRIGIQLFTVRDLLADNELDLPGTFEMLRTPATPRSRSAAPTTGDGGRVRALARQTA